MITQAHIGYPTLFFIIIARIFGIEYSLMHLLLLILFSVLPDLDFMGALFGSKNFNFKHHHWVSHYPITYSPLLILLLIFPSLELSLICLGIYSHFILDSFFGGDGIRFFYPFSKKFYYFFSKKTLGHHGFDWHKIYVKLPIYKIDNLACGLVIITLIHLLVEYSLG